MADQQVIVSPAGLSCAPCAMPMEGNRMSPEQIIEKMAQVIESATRAYLTANLRDGIPVDTTMRKLGDALANAQLLRLDVRHDEHSPSQAIIDAMDFDTTLGELTAAAGWIRPLGALWAAAAVPGWLTGADDSTIDAAMSLALLIGGAVGDRVMTDECIRLDNERKKGTAA